MIEQIITSSVLILSVCVLRIVFEKRISPCMKYSLWLLVAIKLLVPIPDFETTLSIMNVTKSIERISPEEIFSMELAEKQENMELYSQNRNTNMEPYDSNTNTDPGEKKQIDRVRLSKVTGMTGRIGAVILATLFLLSNVSFAWRIRKKRRFVTNYRGLEVYEIDEPGSPCLYGVIKPSIYLSKKICCEDEKREYILLHEYTHYRHRDYLWALVRCCCIILYWYNPLVWIAADLSVKDGELACDEGVIRRIGEENRIAYGKTLVDILEKIKTMSEKRTLLGLSTSMTGGMRDMRKRMKMIVKRPRTKVITVVLITAICVGLIGCTYGNAVTADADIDEIVPTEEQQKNTEKEQAVDQELIAEEFTMEQLLALCEDGSAALQEAFTIDEENGALPYSNLVREEDERWLTWTYRVPLVYDGREYELHASYWVAETAAEYGHKANELDNIMIAYPAVGDGQLLYDIDERFKPNLDVPSFLAREYDIRKYADFELPKGVSVGEYDVNLNVIWQGCRLNGEFEEPAHGEYAPKSWYAPGGIGLAKRENFPGYVHFENNVLQAVDWNMNHGGRDSGYETLEGCDMQAVLCEYMFDLFTPAEMEEYMNAHDLADGELQTTSRYWYVFFAGQDSEYVYTLFLNQEYFSREDIVKMAKTLKFME